MTDRPYVSFAEIKEKVPLPDVLHTIGVAERFKRQGNTLTGVCPLPCHEHGPSPNSEQFKINRRDGLWLWHCFGDCSRDGDVIEFVKLMTSFDNAHVRFWFAEHFGDRLTLSKPRGINAPAPTKEACESAAKQTSQALQNPTANASDAPEPLKPLRFRLDLETSVPYLRHRGVTAETIARYGLGLCNRGTLQGYVAIPVYSWPYVANTNPVGYIGRLPQDDGFTEEKPRYKVPAGFETSRIVYGLRQAIEHSSEQQPLIIVEGPFKVFHLVQAGFPATVSTLTSSMSDEQAAILAATDRRIVLMFDGNEAGHAGMRRAAGRLITQTFVHAIRLTAGLEPDALSPSQLRELLQAL